MAGHMQTFYAIKMLRKVVQETLHIKKLGVPDMISNSVIIKLLSELPDHLEEVKFMSVLP
jgi:hypothetical protein